MLNKFGKDERKKNSKNKERISLIYLIITQHFIISLFNASWSIDPNYLYRNK